MLFLHCQTTWERSRMTQIHGAGGASSLVGGALERMNYTGVWKVLEARCPMRKRKREFIRLQAMEFAALGAPGE